MDEPREASTDGLSPDAAFSLLANETRVTIIEVLWAAWEDAPIPFSELRRRVGMRDAGQFHYHLDTLRDHYVRKRETDDATDGSAGGESTGRGSAGGYELTAAGFKIAQSIVAGTGIDAPVLAGGTLAEACPRCEGEVELTYEDGMIRVYCTVCPGFWSGADQYGQMAEGYIGGWEFPPAGLSGRAPADLLDASIVYMMTRTEALMAGVCPDCGGNVEGTLAVCEDHAPEDGICGACARQFLGAVNWRCDVCKLGFGAPSWAPAVQHPTVRSLLTEVGADFRDDPWRAVNVGYDQQWSESVVSTDPLAVEIEVKIDGRTCELLLDESGHVTT